MAGVEAPPPSSVPPPLTMVSLPAAVPVVETMLPLPAFCANVLPKRTPRSRLKSLLAITMRDSISTWRTGTSSLATSFLISVSLSSVSWTSRVLVRSSMVTLPRSDMTELPLALRILVMSEALA